MILFSLHFTSDASMKVAQVAAHKFGTGTKLECPEVSVADECKMLFGVKQTSFKETMADCIWIVSFLHPSTESFFISEGNYSLRLHRNWELFG